MFQLQGLLVIMPPRSVKRKRKQQESRVVTSIDSPTEPTEPTEPSSEPVHLPELVHPRVEVVNSDSPEPNIPSAERQSPFDLSASFVSVPSEQSESGELSAEPTVESTIASSSVQHSTAIAHVPVQRNQRGNQRYPRNQGVIQVTNFTPLTNPTMQTSQPLIEELTIGHTGRLAPRYTRLPAHNSSARLVLPSIPQMQQLVQATARYMAEIDESKREIVRAKLKIPDHLCGKGDVLRCSPDKGATHLASLLYVTDSIQYVAASHQCVTALPYSQIAAAADPVSILMHATNENGAWSNDHEAQISLYNLLLNVFDGPAYLTCLIDTSDTIQLWDTEVPHCGFSWFLMRFMLIST